MKSISIHALREEGDQSDGQLQRRELTISIHALREEGDLALTLNDFDFEKFLSTPSARRATRREYDNVLPREISIHALREEGDRKAGKAAQRRTISIHALREEGDKFMAVRLADLQISIHALREEGDSKNRDKISIFL